MQRLNHIQVKKILLFSLRSNKHLQLYYMKANELRCETEAHEYLPLSCPHNIGKRCAVDFQ